MRLILYYSSVQESRRKSCRYLKNTVYRISSRSLCCAPADYTLDFVKRNRTSKFPTGLQERSLVLPKSTHVEGVRMRRIRSDHAFPHSGHLVSPSQAESVALPQLGVKHFELLSDRHQYRGLFIQTRCRVETAGRNASCSLGSTSMSRSVSWALACRTTTLISRPIAAYKTFASAARGSIPQLSYSSLCHSARDPLLYQGVAG